VKLGGQQKIYKSKGPGRFRNPRQVWFGRGLLCCRNVNDADRRSRSERLRLPRSSAEQFPAFGTSFHKRSGCGTVLEGRVERLLQSLFIRPSEAADVDSFHLADAGQGGSWWFRWMQVAVGGYGCREKRALELPICRAANFITLLWSCALMPPCHHASFGMTKWMPV
jgi:hypothetical protein